MKCIRMIAVVLCWCISMGWAQAETPIYQLISDETYIQAPLNKEIYLHTNDYQLNDLQVHDANGNSLPYRIQTFSGKSQTIKRETRAIFFPVAVNTSQDELQSMNSNRIHISLDQLQIDIDSPVISDANKIENPDFYLIDLTVFKKSSNSQNQLKLRFLQLHWTSSIKNLYQTWELSASNNLRNWSQLSSTQIVKIEKEGQSLIKDKIPLDINYQDYDYLKLRCIQNCSGIQLSQILISEESIEHHVADDIEWKLEGEMAESQKPIKLGMQSDKRISTVYEFQHKDHVLINSLGIDLGQQMYSDTIRLMGRVREKDPWRLIYQGIWFNTKVGNEWFSSSPVSLPHHYFTQYRLELASKIAAEITPALIFQSTPQFIQFIGNQNPPYSLVVMSDNQHRMTQGRIFETLIRGQSPLWINHQWSYLNPPIREAKSGISWNTWIFWGVLIFAFGVLCFMAIRLFKQLNASR